MIALTPKSDREDPFYTSFYFNPSGAIYPKFFGIFSGSLASLHFHLDLRKSCADLRNYYVKIYDAHSASAQTMVLSSQT